jgi:hypothetical protein
MIMIDDLHESIEDLSPSLEAKVAGVLIVALDGRSCPGLGEGIRWVGNLIEPSLGLWDPQDSF